MDHIETMNKKIRLGFIGANVNSLWASESHFPALLASPDVEMTAVCTRSPSSAEEARKAFGAKFSFHDVRDMAASREIDAIVAVVRVPSHFEVTKAALDAGKPVYTEWPLGRTTAEAVQLAALAREKTVINVVGLQSRVSPQLLYMRELVHGGYVGQVMSCHVAVFRQARLERNASSTWNRDVNQGATPLTIHAGHVLDALEFVAGRYTRLSCILTTQAKQWYEKDTKRFLDVTAPDNVLLSGILENGAVASVRVGAVPCGETHYRMEVYGREGALVVTGNVSSQRGDALRLQGARGADAMADLTIPERFVYVPPNFPKGDPFNVGQMYTLFAQGIRSGRCSLPDFDHAVALHRLLDTMRCSADSGRQVEVDLT